MTKVRPQPLGSSGGGIGTNPNDNGFHGNVGGVAVNSWQGKILRPMPVVSTFHRPGYQDKGFPSRTGVERLDRRAPLSTIRVVMFGQSLYEAQEFEYSLCEMKGSIVPVRTWYNGQDGEAIMCVLVDVDIAPLKKVKGVCPYPLHATLTFEAVT
jgi:hypothetical protein